MACATMAVDTNNMKDEDRRNDGTVDMIDGGIWDVMVPMESIIADQKNDAIEKGNGST